MMMGFKRCGCVCVCALGGQGNKTKISMAHSSNFTVQLRWMCCQRIECSK